MLHVRRRPRAGEREATDAEAALLSLVRQIGRQLHPVDLVLKRLSQDLNLETLFESFPRLTEEDVKACFACAYALLHETQYINAALPPLGRTRARLQRAGVPAWWPQTQRLTRQAGTSRDCSRQAVR